MAHPQSEEAGDAFVSDMDTAAAAISEVLSGNEGHESDDGEDAQDSETSDGEPDEGELDLGDEEQEGEEGEPDDKPAIDIPVSLNAEEKARFAQLPDEAQRFIAELETRRNGQVQQATTKASEAQRNAETRAAQADAQAKAVYANQLKAFADQLAPQRPDPQLAYTDPQAFIALNAQYEAQRAQHDEFVQHVTALQGEAQNGITEAFVQQRDRELMSIPEVQNEESRSGFFDAAQTAAKRIGLDWGEVARNATASEIKALHSINEAFSKADKYDAAMSRQMQRVREGKSTKQAKPNAAQPSSSGKQRAFRDASQKLAKSGDLQDAAAAIAALG